MATVDFVLPSRNNREQELPAFAEKLKEISRQIGFKISARGWCYQIEGFGLINKNQFDLVEGLINDCRESGLLPIDFTAEEEGRKFSGVEVPNDDETPVEFMQRYLDAALESGEYYTPDWWDGEKYYIQMLVEKIDLKTLFRPVCQQTHICIATSKGWSSMLQRAEYAKRFAEAEAKGLTCVLLYCGDHDPDGGRISDFIHKNLDDLRNIVWEDGTDGYDPSDLIIDRFGLNYDFITTNNLTWIDNLITGSKRNLASPSHKNYWMPYVQEYLEKYGARKCEANALVVNPDASRQLVMGAILKYLGEPPGVEPRDPRYAPVMGNPDPIARFKLKRELAKQDVTKFCHNTGLDAKIEEIKQRIKRGGKNA